MVAHADVVEAVLVGMAVVAADGSCLEVNEELCRMVDAPASTLLGSSWTILLAPED